ncbi:HK97 gp10 family phage protein [Morganella morganii]|uniref:HK97 gp10 family phage protein n=1 Tax=Morganella morganii TaxID=582 RepID=UPI0014045E26|nr:HK97 gp10 family phage protein [Morganella morganii]ELF0882896.1 HK97 gp10 family phage protein [Morganella morganii]MBS9569120.1 HK97 gp10 family phage protein [Morganella morganii subsp. morganii]MBT0329289.1 HK97 gp10 family phage protein [Morganella morganii subsp. morganii]MBX9344736.1 HK97 gp10 family phage protein [Morganella morganii]MBX9367887.1 HK97 gp10 family phage protein [Morganella morganii]
MAAKIRGIAEVSANINALVGNITGRKVTRAIQSAMLIGGAQATLFTPIDTSTLINSQFREITVNGTRVTGRVGYSANYAVFVHDPKVKQTFRRATARKEFLTLGFEESRDEIEAAMHQEMRI